MIIRSHRKTTLSVPAAKKQQPEPQVPVEKEQPKVEPKIVKEPIEKKAKKIFQEIEEELLHERE